MSLITCCPSCATRFRVVPDQLRISDGWVRCGRCQEVFDAAAALQEQQEAALAAPQPAAVPPPPPPPPAPATEAAPAPEGTPLPGPEFFPQPAQELEVLLELKVIADVGLVGFPNVGKSTFLSRVTNAQPKIANYHFTTLSPNLGVVDTENGGFVIADIPGLIEGASEGVGLGHEFLRHIERTRVIIHIVDAASTEGRDPIDDIYKINKELEAYNPEIAARPQVIAANKIDCIYTEDGEESPIDKLKAEFEPKGIQVYPISAVSGQGVRELLFHVKELLDSCPQEPVVFEQEFFPEDMLIGENLPYTVEQSPEDPTIFVVEGPKIEKMLGYTNLDSEKGFAFFQKFLKEGGILEELEKAGIQEGDTVRMYGFDFDYYK